MVTRTALSIRNRHCGSTCCNLTFRYCFHIRSSVIPQTCITKHVFSNSKCLLRFFIPRNKGSATLRITVLMKGLSATLKTCISVYRSIIRGKKQENLMDCIQLGAQKKKKKKKKKQKKHYYMYVDCRQFYCTGYSGGTLTMTNITPKFFLMLQALYINPL